MICINIQEQRELLGSRLKTELLTASIENKAIIQTFHADNKGKGLEVYLRENAWEEDQKGITKVYLVKDTKTEEIVFYFALSAGLLYKEIGSDSGNLSEVEKEIINYCIDAFQDEQNHNTVDEVLSWYENEPIDRERLQRIIDERIRFKLAAKEDPEKSKSVVNIKQVSETFPSIVLTHFCKNADYTFTEKLKFPIGFYVFWEIVVKEVLHIASILGCQYLYLFAADNTDRTSFQFSRIYPGDWDVDEPVMIPVYKLVEYYKNEFKFEDVQDVTILKPYYDLTCFSLIQRVDKLSENRNAAWIQHSDVDE